MTDEWISVKDKLPDREKIVISCIIGSDIICPLVGETLEDAIKRSAKKPVRVCLSFIDDDGKWYDYAGWPEIISPSYWMPLPNPPKGERL